MLRRLQKKKIIEYISQAELDNSIMEIAMVENVQNENQDKDIAYIQEHLASCQQAAVDAGTILEQCEAEELAIIPFLEAYCEEIYQTSLDLEHIQVYKQTLDSILQQIKEKVEQLQIKYQIVFMPYKASMWDSLESIYLATREDPSAECLLIPIPYFNLADHAKGELHPIYEGNLFPDGEEVTSYLSYDLSLERPDIIYVHNPYDEYNHVTSIHPSYYSAELKKYTDNLVYIPYYVTAGFFSVGHRMLSVYRNMDYMIAQSEYFKGEADGLFYQDRMLPLGSPKLDKVINTCKERSGLPAEWAKLIASRKSVMLNTSIGCMLSDTEAYLTKLKHLFSWFEKHKDVALVWRPHPLMEATMESLRPTLLNDYLTLVNEFKEKKIGVYDTTPEIATTIACVDAYIGENSTSVINLFGAAGKPIFILNNYIFTSFLSEEQKRLLVEDMCVVGEKLWVSTSYGLFVMEKGWQDLRYIPKTEGQSKWVSPYQNLMQDGDKIIMSPLFAMSPQIFDTVTEQYTKLDGLKNKEDLKFKEVITYKDSIIFLPYVEEREAIYEYQNKTQTWQLYEDCIKGLKQDCEGPFYENTYAHAVKGELLYISATYTNKILVFDMEHKTHRYLEIAEKGVGFSGIVVDGDELWLTEVHSGIVLRLNLKTGESHVYPMPENYRYWENTVGRNLANSALLDMGEWIVTIPAFSNAVVKIHKNSGVVESVLEELFQIPDEEINGYRPNAFPMVSKAIKYDTNSILLQRYRDCNMIKLDITTNRYEMNTLRMSGESLTALLDGEDGFEKIDTTAEFSRKESPLFSLEDFMHDLVEDRLEDVKIRQKKELSNLAANLDGTCGQHVYEYMMQVLREER